VPAPGQTVEDLLIWRTPAGEALPGRAATSTVWGAQERHLSLVSAYWPDVRASDRPVGFAVVMDAWADEGALGDLA